MKFDLNIIAVPIILCAEDGSVIYKNTAVSGTPELRYAKFITLKIENDYRRKYDSILRSAGNRREENASANIYLQVRRHSACRVAFVSLVDGSRFFEEYDRPVAMWLFYRTLQINLLVPECDFRPSGLSYCMEYIRDVIIEYAEKHLFPVKRNKRNGSAERACLITSSLRHILTYMINLHGDPDGINERFDLSDAVNILWMSADYFCGRSETPIHITCPAAKLIADEKITAHIYNFNSYASAFGAFLLEIVHMQRTGAAEISFRLEEDKLYTEAVIPCTASSVKNLDCIRDITRREGIPFSVASMTDSSLNNRKICASMSIFFINKTPGELGVYRPVPRHSYDAEFALAVAMLLDSLGFYM